jgi:hypothetical protein
LAKLNDYFLIKTMFLVAFFLVNPLTGEAKTTIAPETNTIVNLHYQHEWATNPEVIPALPPRFYSFTRSEYTPRMLVGSFPQKIKMQYLSTNTARTGHVFQKDYPLKPDMLDNDELSFLHSTNPAIITIVELPKEKALFFQKDQRYLKKPGVTYNIYKADKGFKNATTFQELKGLSWRKIASVESDKEKSFVEFREKDSSSVSNKAGICYMVKTVTEGVEHNYGLPVCKANAIQDLKGWVIASTKSEIDIPSSARIPGQYSFNVHYTINAAGVELSPGSLNSAKIVAYKFQNNCENELLGDACINGFKRFREYPMKVTKLNPDGQFIATADFMYARPYLVSILGKNIWPFYSKGLVVLEYTEQIVYKIEAGEMSFPTEGYFTVHTNNRVRDRIWAGFQTNPEGEAYRSVVKSIVADMQNQGFNGVFLDEWRPEKTVSDKGWRYGWQMEAPTIEYPYSSGYEDDPEQDPWIHALDGLATWLHREFPKMLFIGNTIKASQDYHQKLALRALKGLDGGLFEYCFASNLYDKGLPDITEKIWQQHIAVLEEALSTNKIVICLVRSHLPAVLSPRLRFYNLASFLMVHQPEKPILYANSEINPKLLAGTPHFPATYFPEYDINLGKPVEAMQIPSPFFAKRAFERGLVLVNASKSTPRQFTAQKNLRSIGLKGIVMKGKQLNMGRLCGKGEQCSIIYGKGQTINMPPATGLILIDEP